MFEVRMMRMPFVTKSEKLFEERRKLHSEKIYAFYSSSDVIWEIYLRKVECA
jgi:hypothetical protein